MSETTRDLDTSVPLSDKGLRRDIGKLGLLFVSCGAIIGSSWLFVPVTAAKLAGPAAVLSWVIGIVLILLIVVTFAELSAMFPVAGGVSRFPQYSFGSFASYTMGWITWLAIAAVPPIEVLATLQYASAYLPHLFERADDVPVLTPVGIAVSVVLMAVYAVINVLGVKLFARVNNVMVWWKLVTVVLVSVILVATTFDPARFTAASTGGFAPYGFGSVLSAVASGGIVFSFLGCRQAVDLAAESTRPHRNVPFALLGSALLCGVILIFLQVAVTGAVPADALAGGWAHLALADGFGPLAGLAGAVGLTWLVVLIRVDAVVSPFDTGLIYAASAARVSYAQGRNGNAPSWLTKINAKGVPWASILVMFVVGCLFFLPFPSWQKLAGFITSATILSFGAGPLVVAALRRQLPEQARPFRLPGGDLLPFLAFLAATAITYWAGWETNARLFVAVLLGYVVLALHYRFAADRGAIPPMRLRNGSWVVVWFAGLAVCSWLGPFDGGLGVLSALSSTVALVVLSSVVYLLALRVRLDPAEVRENIERQRMDDAGDRLEIL